MDQKINRVLLPDIKYSDEKGEHTFSYTGGASPLEQALNSTDKSLFLVAMGGQGKTTTLRTLWLDFLRGKNDIPCLYVDCKLLDKSEKDKAIHTYIKNEYGVDIAECKLDSKFIILLDGANESDAHLRQGDAECNLVKESKTLINQGFRLVISGRSSYISEHLGGNETRKTNELDESIMQYCELCKLSEQQLVKVIGDEIEDSALNKLLKNNMMLSIYLNLGNYGEQIDKNITTGKLLEKYFNICFKTRFIQSVLKLNKDEKTTYDKIKKIEEDHLVNPNKMYQDCEYQDISEKISYFKNFIKYLTNNSWKSEFYKKLLEVERIYLPVLEHLSILQECGFDTYVWSNEIYQEYFKARKFYKIFHEIEKIGLSDGLENLESTLKEMLHHEISVQYFNVLKYAGELLNINTERISYLLSLLGYNYALRTCLVVMSVLTGLGIPKRIKYIEDYTFSKCLGVRKIDLTEIFAIGDEAFSNCKLLEEVVFQSAIDQIGTLNNKKILESIISTKVGRIGEKAFYSCKKLKSIAIPNTFRVIGESAFAYCDSLETVILSKTITWIDDAAFRGCKKLKEINITGVDLNVTLGEDVFSCCESLVSVNLSYGVRDIGEYAFSECKALKNITLPLSVHEIKECTFRFCKSLESINLPEQLEEIGKGAFWGCESLKEITLPESLIKIGETAFEYCIALKEITLPENLQEIDTSAFMYCRELKRIYISEKTNIISDNKIVEGFYACHATLIRY